MKKNINTGLLVVRSIISFTMLLYGIHKLFNGVSGIETMLKDHNLPGAFSYGVYAGEIISPILILIGYRTRLAAIVFAVNCITAIALAKTDTLFQLNESGGWAVDILMIYLFAGIAFFFTGAGKYAVSSGNKWD